MENVGKEPSTIQGNLHGPGYSGANALAAAFALPKGHFSDRFCVFAVEWEPQIVRFFTDGILYSTKTPADVPDGKRWVFDHPFFLILNLAVGGNFPGNPDDSTIFPGRMLVDYVRVYSAKSSTAMAITGAGKGWVQETAGVQTRTGSSALFLTIRKCEAFPAPLTNQFCAWLTF
jgi:beta-glucanase (GH16 family)